MSTLSTLLKAPLSSSRISMLLEIPEELLELILLCLQTPKDLLRLALTCRSLCGRIVPAHLNFIDISSDLDDSTLWSALKGCPKLARRVRKLELVDEENYYCALKDGCKSGVRQNTRMGSGGATTATFSDVSTDAVDLFKLSLRLMKGLNLLVMKQPISQTTLHEVLTTISDLNLPLEALSINMDMKMYSSLTVLPCQLTYHHLTSFAISVTKPEHLRSTETIFEHLIFRCPSLTNLSLVSHSAGCLYSPRFLQHGHWPSLRRLTLFGWLNLYPHGTVLPGVKTKLAVSFFQRHPLLESLWVADTYSSSSIQQETFLYRSAFPSLRSLCLTDQIPIQLLDRLYHIEDLEQIPACRFDQAKSLRSCTFSPRRIDDVYALAKTIPQLERLAYSFDSGSLSGGCDEHTSYTLPCPCPLGGIREALSRFKNLTHLSINIICYPSQYTTSLDEFRCMIERLPKLRFFHLAVDSFGPWYIIERERDETGKNIILRYREQTNNLSAAYHYQRWGDFFTGSLIDQYL